MAKIKTIKENHLFSKVYARGKSVAQRDVVVYALRNYRKPGEVLLGLTVGKKLGGAVQRSRARRILRQAWLEATKGRRFRQPMLIVLVGRSGLTDPKRKTGDLVPQIVQALNKLALTEDDAES